MRENDNFFNLSHPYFIKHIKKTIFILLTYAKKPTPKAQNAKEVFMSGQSLYSLSGTVVPYNPPMSTHAGGEVPKYYFTLEPSYQNKSCSQCQQDVGKLEKN